MPSILVHPGPRRHTPNPVRQLLPMPLPAIGHFPHRHPGGPGPEGYTDSARGLRRTRLSWPPRLLPRATRARRGRTSRGDRSARTGTCRPHAEACPSVWHRRRFRVPVRLRSSAHARRILPRDPPGSLVPVPFRRSRCTAIASYDHDRRSVRARPGAAEPRGSGYPFDSAAPALTPPGLARDAARNRAGRIRTVPRCVLRQGGRYVRRRPRVGPDGRRRPRYRH